MSDISRIRVSHLKKASGEVVWSAWYPKGDGNESSYHRSVDAGRPLHPDVKIRCSRWPPFAMAAFANGSLRGP